MYNYFSRAWIKVASHANLGCHREGEVVGGGWLERARAAMATLPGCDSATLEPITRVPPPARTPHPPQPPHPDDTRTPSPTQPNSTLTAVSAYHLVQNLISYQVLTWMDKSLTGLKPFIMSRITVLGFH